jgi:hypothetical protein
MTAMLLLGYYRIAIILFVFKILTILLRGIQLAHVQHYLGSTVKMVFFIYNFYFSWGQYICGAPERLTEFGASTFLVLSQQ